MTAAQRDGVDFEKALGWFFLLAGLGVDIGFALFGKPGAWGLTFYLFAFLIYAGERDEEVAAARIAPRHKPQAAGTGDHAEVAYWNFDARRKGYAKWAGAPMSERDAFKAEYRAMLAARTEQRE